MDSKSDWLVSLFFVFPNWSKSFTNKPIKNAEQIHAACAKGAKTLALGFFLTNHHA